MYSFVKPVTTLAGMREEGFAAKHGISKEEAERLIERIGYDTSELGAAAQKLKLDR